MQKKLMKRRLGERLGATKALGTLVTHLLGDLEPNQQEVRELKSQIRFFHCFAVVYGYTSALANFESRTVHLSQQWGRARPPRLCALHAMVMPIGTVMGGTPFRHLMMA